jgi:hypothetical protein
MYVVICHQGPFKGYLVLIYDKLTGLSSILSTVGLYLIGKNVKMLMVSVGPKVTTRRGVIWPRDSVLPGGRGREPGEPAREGQGLKYPSVRLGMI